jgi:hypothetical protein
VTEIVRREFCVGDIEPLRIRGIGIKVRHMSMEKSVVLLTEKRVEITAIFSTVTLTEDVRVN